MEEEYKKFAKYLEGSMSEKECLAFETEMAENSKIESAYQEYVGKQQHLDDRENKPNAHTSLEAIHTEFREGKTQTDVSNPSKIKRPARIFLFVILVLALVFAFLYFGKFFEKPLTPEEIYASEFSVPAMMLKTKGPGALKEYNQKGFEAFADNKFDLVLQLLDTISTEYDPAVQSQILLAQAISLAETESYEESNVYFDFLREKYPHMNATANWYEGLSHLKRGEVDQAKALLKRIPTSSSYFQRAREIQGSI